MIDSTTYVTNGKDHFPGLMLLEKAVQSVGLSQRIRLRGYKFHVKRCRKPEEFRQAVQDMFVEGVSTRKVKRALKSLVGEKTKLGRSSVSRITKALRRSLPAGALGHWQTWSRRTCECRNADACQSDGVNTCRN